MDTHKVNYGLSEYTDRKGLITPNPYKMQLHVAIFTTVAVFLVVFSAHYFIESFSSSVFGIIWSSIFILAVLKSYYGIYETRKKWFHFGRVTLQMKPLPGVVGSNISGNISILKNYAGKQFSLELACKYHYEEKIYGSGSDDRTVQRADLVWSSGKIAVKQKSADTGIVLLFNLNIPDGLPDSGALIKNYHSWEMKLTSEGGKFEMNREFILPFFSQNNAHAYSPHKQ